MRIKIMVATAIALAAIGLKSLDSGRSAQESIRPADLGTQNDAAWPPDRTGSNSP